MEIPDELCRSVSLYVLAINEDLFSAQRPRASLVPND